MQRADGTTFPSEHVVSFVGDRDNGDSGYVVSVVRDVTERARGQESARLVNEMTIAIAEARDFEAALEESLARFGRHVGWQYAEAWTPAEVPGREPLSLECMWSSFADRTDDPDDALIEFVGRSHTETFDFGRGLPGWTWKRGETICLNDVSSSDRYRRSQQAEKLGLKAAIAAPVEPAGEPVAVLVWYTTQSFEVDQTVRELAETVTNELGAFLYRRDIEQALRTERDQFQALASNISEVLWMSSVDKSTIHYVNEACARVWGRPVEELVENPETWIQAVHEEDRERVREAAQRQVEGAYDEVYRVVQPDGEIRWVRDRAYPLQRDGEVKRIVGTVQDITEQKRAKERLEISEKKFSKVFQMNPLAMSIVRWEDGRIVDVNEGFTEQTGWERSRAVGATIDELERWVHEEDRRSFYRRLDEESAVDQFETKLRRAGGTVRDVLVSAQIVEVDGESCILSATQDVTDRKRYEAELERQAFHDRLTGLPNRRLFCDRVEHVLGLREDDDPPVAVALVDVSRLRTVNDTLGHAAGDELLELIANRLVECVDDNVTVARFGGDEFALLFEGVDAPEALEQQCDEWVREVTEPCEIAGTDVFPNVNVGIATGAFAPDEVDDLLRYANVAVNRAQSREESSITRYRHEDDAGAVERLHRENALRRALDDDQFTLRYQPVVDLTSGEAVGAEVLIRWEHPERGLISPGEFIPLAEETGLIVPMGYRVLEMVADRAAEWPRRAETSGGTGGFSVAVNLSVRQYQEPDLADRLRQIAGAAGFPLGQLVLEITESVLVTGDGRLTDLRDEGVRISIDDFGTGYSSLQYLRRLDADELKIDQTFSMNIANNERDRILVESILEIAEKCGLSVVVEGVETERQRELLIDMGAERAQGYHFAKPMRAEEFEDRYLP
jgi:diguanylate cyclase (GGDEF)-like protein/PAS domain S-box-containing protein